MGFHPSDDHSACNQCTAAHGLRQLTTQCHASPSSQEPFEPLGGSTPPTFSSRVTQNTRLQDTRQPREGAVQGAAAEMIAWPPPATTPRSRRTRRRHLQATQRNAMQVSRQLMALGTEGPFRLNARDAASLTRGVCTQSFLGRCAPTRHRHLQPGTCSLAHAHRRRHPRLCTPKSTPPFSCE